MDYTNLYDFQTSTGIIVPTDSSVLLGIQTKFQEIFGTDIDLSAETPVGRLIEAFAVVVKSTLGITAQAANQFNVNEATGIYLDAIAQIYDLKRIAGTKTRLNIKCFFSANQTQNVAPAGSYVMCSSNGAMFSLDSDIYPTELDADTGQYVGIGSATALDAGPVVAPEGTVTSIQTGAIGWVGVTNIAPTYTGTDIETDEAFRKRILASRPIGVGFNSHLVSALNRLDGVYSNCVLENNTDETIVKKGVEIPPHSVYVCVDCIETNDLNMEIADEIARVKPIGTGMVNTTVEGLVPVVVTKNYGYNNGSWQEIYFYRAKKTLINVDLTYSPGNYTGSNITGDIATAIAEYMGTIEVGGRISGTMITNHLINTLNIGVGQVWLQKQDSGIPADIFVEMNGYEAPYAATENIFMEETA